MHSKIFQITETRVDRDNYLNEDTLEQGGRTLLRLLFGDRRGRTQIPYCQSDRKGIAKRDVHSCGRKHNPIQWRCGQVEKGICYSHPRKGTSRYR